MTAFHWSRQRPLIGPAMLKSGQDQAVRQSRDFGPFGNGAAYTVQCQEATTPPIPGLFGLGGPSAVLGAVWAIVVDPIQGLTRWRVTHVGIEAIEALPPLTDGDATSPVTRISGGGNTLTSGTHLAPNPVGATSGHSVLDVLWRELYPWGTLLSGNASFLFENFGRPRNGGPRDLSSEASTASRPSVTKIRGQDLLLCSTVASTSPVGVPVIRPDPIHDNKASEPLPGQVDEVLRRAMLGPDESIPTFLRAEVVSILLDLPRRQVDRSFTGCAGRQRHRSRHLTQCRSNYTVSMVA